LDIHEERIGRPAQALTTSLHQWVAAFISPLWRDPTVGTDRYTFTGGSMDLVVAAVVVALAALSFIWLAFVERA
jgi:hypothetical protein